MNVRFNNLICECNRGVVFVGPKNASQRQFMCVNSACAHANVRMLEPIFLAVPLAAPMTPPTLTGPKQLTSVKPAPVSSK
jgi:hypothetical protein